MLQGRVPSPGRAGWGAVPPSPDRASSGSWACPVALHSANIYGAPECPQQLHAETRQSHTLFKGQTVHTARVRTHTADAAVEGRGG